MALFGKKNSILGGWHLERRDEARVLLGRLRKALETFDKDLEPSDKRKLLEADSRLSELFLVVVAGEFNSGKSAFINALIGERVLTEGVTPTTDRICVLRFAASAREKRLDDFVVEMGHPAPLLRDLSFVDTPGTNAIIRRHEELTREFVPRSDLILFVTSADRPFAETERAFLEQIRAWGKKIVFIVNKVDILDRDDVGKVEEFVRTHATELLGTTPEVFPISARAGFEARQAGDEEGWQQSGMARVLSFLEETLDEEERVRLKLLSPVGVGLHVADTYLELAGERLRLLEEDRNTIENLEGQLASHQKSMSRRFAGQLELVTSMIDDLEQRGMRFFDSEIRVGNLRALLSSSGIEERFAKEVVGDLERQIEEAIQTVIDWMLDQHLKLWQDVNQYLEERRLSRHREKMVGETRPHFEYNRQALLDSVGRTADRVASGYNREVEAAAIANEVKDMLATTALAEAGAIGVGALLVALLTGAVADVTGILFATALAVGGFYIIPSRRRRVKAEFKEKVSVLRSGLVEALTRQLDMETRSLVDRIETTISPYTRFVRFQVENLEASQKELTAVREGLLRLKREVERA